MSIYSNRNKIAYGVKRFNLNKLENLLKINTKPLTPGSIAFIIETSKYYMLNNKKMWIEINPSGSGTSNENSDIYRYDGGGIDDIGTVFYDGGSIDD